MNIVTQTLRIQSAARTYVGELSAKCKDLEVISRARKAIEIIPHLKYAKRLGGGERHGSTTITQVLNLATVKGSKGEEYSIQAHHVYHTDHQGRLLNQRAEISYHCDCPDQRAPFSRQGSKLCKHVLAYRMTLRYRREQSQRDAAQFFQKAGKREMVNA